MTMSSIVSVLKESGCHIFAHRGISGVYPENTLLAFLKSPQHKTRLIELDVRMTKDGKLVVIHDATVDRTTQGSGRVGDFSLDQLKELDSGYRFSGGEGSFPFRGKGHDIPTLEEVLHALPDCMFSIELKDSSDEACHALLALIRKFDAFERVVVNLIGIKSRTARRLRRMDKRLLTGHTRIEIAWFYILLGLKLTRFFKPRGISFEIPLQKYGHDLATVRAVEAAHKCGVAVIVWTINDRETFLRLSEMGVDAVMSDYPGRLLGLTER